MRNDMTQHTPGPWDIKPYQHVLDGTRLHITTLPPNGYKDIADLPHIKCCRPVCEQSDDVTGGYACYLHREQLANARLIAAAPMLLRALEEAMAWLDAHPHHDRLTVNDFIDGSGFSAMASDAIRAARGDK